MTKEKRGDKKGIGKENGATNHVYRKRCGEPKKKRKERGKEEKGGAKSKMA